MTQEELDLRWADFLYNVNVQFSFEVDREVHARAWGASQKAINQEIQRLTPIVMVEMYHKYMMPKAVVWQSIGTGL